MYRMLATLNSLGPALAGSGEIGARGLQWTLEQATGRGIAGA
jgi:hypothetical protein